MRVRMVAAAALLAVAVGGPVWVAKAEEPAAEKTWQVEGKVGDVDLLERAIEVDGHAGLFPRRVVIGPQTVVTMPSGRRDSISAIREGDRVLATYHKVDDQLVADDVVVLYSQEELAQPPAGAVPRQGP